MKTCIKCGQEKPFNEFYHDVTKGKAHQCTSYCKICQSKTSCLWAKNNLSRRRKTGWIYRENLRIDVLTQYSPNKKLGCSWDRCEVVDSDMLVLDHIKDDGGKQRKQLGFGGWAFYSWLKLRQYPEGYQTLCCNHNHKKEMIRKRSTRKS